MITPSEYRAIGQKVAKPKYRSVATVVDGIRFASKKEARRWGELRLLEKAGKISGLERQVTFHLEVNGVLICRYRADFQYRENGKPVTEDTKGVQTPEFKLKSKLMKAIYGIDVVLT